MLTMATAKPAARVQAGRRRPSRQCATSRAQQQAPEARKMLLVTAPGGNHAALGYWCARHLAQRGHKVTCVVPGEGGDEKGMGKPFMYFDHLRNLGVSIHWGDVKSAAPDEEYDVCIDNNAKDPDTVAPTLDVAEKARAKHVVFVSSCGVYDPVNAPPLLESDPVKGSAGQVKVESLLSESAFTFSSLRPQYPTGYGHIDRGDTFFFDRLHHNRPILIPGDGMQLVNLWHASDLGKMMAMAADSDAAKNQIFNCVGDKGVTLDGIAKLCAKAVNGESQQADIRHYSPENLGIDPREAFPFRANWHFYAEPRKAKELLGWQPETSLEHTLRERYQEYKETRDQGKVDFSMDDNILSALGS